MSEANLSLNNVKLRQDALLKLSMPVRIELGEIRHLDVKIPWLKIGSKPVIVTVEGLNVIVSLQQKDQWEVFDIFSPQYLEQTLLAQIAKIEAELQTDQEGQSYLTKLAMKVLDNIQIKISDIHFRFEDHVQDRPFSFGIVLKLLQVQTTNEAWEVSYVDRTQSSTNPNLFKTVVIEDFGLYLNPYEHFVIHLQTANQERRLQLLEAQSVDSSNRHLQYLLKPLSIQLQVEHQTKGDKRMSFNVSLESLHLSFMHEQLKCALKFFEVLSSFKGVQNQLYKTKKYKFLRPLMQTRVTRRNAKQWWLYAYQCIKRSNKAKNGSLREFIIPKQRVTEYQQAFTKVLQTCLVKKDGQFSLNLGPEQREVFIHVMSAVDSSFLKNLIVGHLTQLTKKPVTSQKSFVSWLLGSKQAKKSEAIITEQEAQAIESEIFAVDEFRPVSQTLSLNLQIKEVMFDLASDSINNKAEGIRLFSRMITLSYFQQPQLDLTFDASCSIDDFGVELFTLDQKTHFTTDTQSFIVSNKKILKDDMDHQLQIRVRKRPEELKEIEYDIYLKASPLMLLYSKEFVQRAMVLSKIDINEETQNAATDKMDGIREATSNQVYSLIYKKANRFNIDIASPVIVLPLSSASDSPVWVLRLGDLNMTSLDTEQRTAVVEYEMFKFQVEAMRMIYFSSSSLWTSSLTNMKDRQSQVQGTKDVFHVIEDCTMTLKVGIKQKKAGMLVMTAEQTLQHAAKPKLRIEGLSSDIRVNLTHSIFNKLYNIGAIFDLTQEEQYQRPIIEMHIQSKQAILANAKKTGQVLKKLENQWESYFVVVSGGYLYLYNSEEQKQPITYFYIKGSMLTECDPDVGLKYNIVLKNRSTEYCLAFANEHQMQEWSSLFKEVIYSFLIEAESAQIMSDKPVHGQSQGINKKPVNLSAVVSFVEIRVPMVSISLVDELKQPFEPWLKFALEGTKVQKQTRKADSTMSFGIRRLHIRDQTRTSNQSLFTQKRDRQLEDALFCSIQELSKKSPDYKNVGRIMQIKLRDLRLRFFPATINELLKFFKNTKPGCSYNLIEVQQPNFDELYQRHESVMQSFESDLGKIKQIAERKTVNQVKDKTLKDTIKELSCRHIKEVNEEMHVVLESVSMELMHPNHNQALYAVDSSLIKVDQTSCFDHVFFAFQFRDAVFTDLTGYPCTMDPAQQDHRQPIVPREFASIKARTGSEFCLTVHLESYYSENCCLAKKGITGKLVTRVEDLKLEFFNEAFMRFFNYFFQQFMVAMTNTDPYVDTMQEEFEAIKQRKTMRKNTVKMMGDFQQVTTHLEMDVTLTNFQIIIPDRPRSKTFLALTAKEFHVSQQVQLKAGRVYSDKEKELYVSSFRMQATKCRFSVNGETILTERPFNMQIIYESLAYSPIMLKVDPKVVDQSSHVRLRFDPLQFRIRQDIYTQLLRIMDLNINFTDFLERQYYFFQYFEIEKYFRTLSNVVGMRIKVTFQCLSLRLEHMDATFLAELMFHQMSLKMTKYRDFKSDMNVTILNFFIFDKPQQAKLYTTTGAQKMAKLLNLEDCVAQPKVMLQDGKKQERQVEVLMTQLPNGERAIKTEIQGLRITIKPHTLMMIYYFLLNSFPEYEQSSPDKPSFIDFNPEQAPKMEFVTVTKDCLLVFQNRPGLKTLACKGKISFEFLRQNVSETKHAITTGELFDADSSSDENRSDDNEADKKKRDPKLPSPATTDVVWHMRITIEDFCPFVCSLNQMNEHSSFERINKRQLLNPISLDYLTQFTLQRDSQKKFGVTLKQSISASKIKMKISLQDMHLIFQIVTFANQNILYEYVQKLEQIDKFIKAIKGAEQELMMPVFEKVDNSITEDDQDIEDVVNKQYEQTIASQVQRLRSTTKAFQSIAHRYTKVALRKTQVLHRKKAKGAHNNYIKQVFKGINLVEESKESENSMEIQLGRKGRTYVENLMMSESKDSKRDEEFYDACSSQLFKSALDQNESLVKSEIEGGNSPQIKQRQKSIVVPKIVYDNAMENLISSISSYRLGGLQIIFINDYGNVFCPVIDIDIPQMDFTQHMQDSVTTSSTSLNNLRVFYYNAVLGDWEPLIESLDLAYEATFQIRRDKSIQSTMFLDLPTPININLTESCLQNMIETYYSWMETPPFAVDEYRRKSEVRNLTFKDPSPKPTSLIKSNNTGSINDDKYPMIEDESEQSDIENESPEAPIINSENFNKVSPYSIKNLSGYPLKVIASKRAAVDTEVSQVNLSILEAISGNSQQLRMSTMANTEALDVLPNQIADYSVDLDKESNNFLAKEHNKRTRRMTELAGPASSVLANPQESKKRYRNEELINIVFDNFEEIRGIDLNKIQQKDFDLVPIQSIEANLLIDRASQLTDESPSKRRPSKKKQKYLLVQKEYEKLRYGVALNQMRKVLTIRQEYVIDNRTMLDYLIRIQSSVERQSFKEYIVRQGCQLGLSSQYYGKDYTIQIRLLNQKSHNMEADGGTFSQGVPFTEIRQASTEYYSIVSHDTNLFTVIRKLPGEIKDTFDLAFIPPVSIKNCLPCSIKVMSQLKDVQAEHHSVYKFEKEEEKHFHNIGYQGIHADEIMFRLRVSGYVWSNIILKKSLSSEEDDKVIKIRDANGNVIDICMRVMHLKAGYQLIFYAFTVILNNSGYNLTFFFNTLTKSVVAGQEQKRDFVIANKDDSILASISGRYSSGLSIKNAGITEHFTIQTSANNVSMDEEARGQHKGSASFIQNERKYSFVYQVYMSLVSADESVYTKIVSISPQYVMFNKMSRAICLAQTGNDFQYDVLETGDRKEWYWPDSVLEDTIRVKKASEDADRDWKPQSSLADKINKKVRWLFSEPISLKKIGVRTLAIKKDQDRFRRGDGYDLIKVIIKQIEVRLSILTPCRVLLMSSLRTRIRISHCIAQRT